MAPAKTKNRVFVIGVGMTKVNYQHNDATREKVFSEDFKANISANSRL